VKRNHKRIQRVLDVRQLQERALRAHWAEAEREARNGEDNAVVAGNRTVQARHDLAQSSQVGHCDARAALLDFDNLDLLSRDASRLRESARGLRQEADDRRQPWNNKRRAVQGLERLVESRRNGQRKEKEQKEQSSLDEFAASGFLARATKPFPIDLSVDSPGLSPSSPSVATPPMPTQNRPYPSSADPSFNGDN
jgi:flagellar export protein FliJ